MTNYIHIKRVLPVPLERVWEAWIDSKLVGSWFAAEANIVPERGGAYELFLQPINPEHESSIGCRITAIAPNNHICFTWRGPDSYKNVMNEGNPPPPPTHVSIKFERRSSDTQIEVSHVGFGSNEEWKEVIEWHRIAWNKVLDNLEAFLTGHPLPFPWEK